MKNCDNCRYVTTSFDVPPCSECVCESKWEQQTNADRIRVMTDEELEPYILAIKLGFNPWCDYHCENEGDDGCDTCILNWLKQPAEV